MHWLRLFEEKAVATTLACVVVLGMFWLDDPLVRSLVAGASCWVAYRLPAVLAWRPGPKWDPRRGLH